MIEGHCLCGAVRFRAQGEPRFVAHCHCQSCRRQVGGVISTFAGYATKDVEWIKGSPTAYASSPGVARSFCKNCGTPLAYESDKRPGDIDVAASRHTDVGFCEEKDVSRRQYRIVAENLDLSRQFFAAFNVPRNNPILTACRNGPVCEFASMHCLQNAFDTRANALEYCEPLQLSSRATLGQFCHHGPNVAANQLCDLVSLNTVVPVFN